MRSLLFVPANGGSKLDKAFASGADAVIVDLEDSIAPDRKDEARANSQPLVRLSHGQIPCELRISGRADPDGAP